MEQSKLKSKTFVSEESAKPPLIFRFNLPNGLSLRSASVVDDIAELRFTSSPRVPSLQESDIAAAFRLAAENKRPEFFYGGFPPDHPLSGSRWFNEYCPQWLRGTTLGELLADVDWNMKCLHVGAKSNEDKTSFKSWSASSSLKGLATRLDFPKNNIGSIYMYCEYAKVHICDDEIFFPEEPKMKIDDKQSRQYSEYITKHLPSVAYHDEPKFLKMQEVIKLILAVEWLYNEKKVRVDQSWIQLHTENFTEEENCTLLQSFHESKPPLDDMIPPTPSDFKPPSTDVTVSTKHSQMHKALMENQAKRRYGYTDFQGCDVRIFTEEGEELFFQSSLKQSFIFHAPIGDLNIFRYIAIDELYLKNTSDVLNSLKFPLPIEDENFVPETPDFNLYPPKVPLNHEYFMMQLHNTIIRGSLPNNSELINSDGINHVNKESPTDKSTFVDKNNAKMPPDNLLKVGSSTSTLPDAGSPTSEFPSSTDKEKPNFKEKKDLLIPKQELSTAIDTSATTLPLFQTEAVNQFIDKLEMAHTTDFFGPLKTIMQSLENPSTDESQIPTEEQFLQTMITCFERMLEFMTEAAHPIPITVFVNIKHFYLSDDDFKMTANVSLSRHVPFTLPLFELNGTMKMAMEDMDYLFSHIDPNAPVRAAIPGLCDALIPQVRSWNELLSELSTPAPRFWLDPYTGVGEQTACGGVSTKTIPIAAACAVPIINTVALAGALLNKSSTSEYNPPGPHLKSEPPPGQRSLKISRQSEGSPESHNESKASAHTMYSHSEGYGGNKRKKRKHRTKKSPEVFGTYGETLIVHATEARGNIEMLSDDEKKKIAEKFDKSWKGNSPEIVAVYEIFNENLEIQWKNYRSKLPSHFAVTEEHYHGTALLCSIADKQKLCTLRNCEVCSIAHYGMNKESSKRHRSSNFFKKGVILSPYSSSCDGYTEENKKHYRAMLLCDVLPGRKYNLQTHVNYSKLPEGYNSFHATTDDDLTSPVLVITQYEAVLPKYIILYKHFI